MVAYERARKRRAREGDEQREHPDRDRAREPARGEADGRGAGE
jgi:hypothetical protein